MTLAWICYLVILRKNLGIPCSRRFEQETDIPFKLSLQIVIFFGKLIETKPLLLINEIWFVRFPNEARLLKTRTTLCNTKTFHPDEWNARQIELTEKKHNVGLQLRSCHAIILTIRGAFRLAGSRGYRDSCRNSVVIIMQHAARSSIGETRPTTRTIFEISFEATRCPRGD